MRMTQQPLALPKATSDLAVVAPKELAPVTNSPGTWAPVPGLSTTVFTAPGANLAATVSAEVYTTHNVWFRVLIDGAPSSPGDVVFRMAGADYDGVRSFTFGREGLSAGKHVVQVEWFSGVGEPARVRDRTLSVNSEAAGDGRVAHVAAESAFLTKTTSVWEDVPALSRTVNLATASNLKMTFSGNTFTGTGRFFARALVDGVPADDVLFEDRGVVGGARSYAFWRPNIAAGSHTIRIQWYSEGGTIQLADRALTVYASPSLVGTNFQGGPDPVTSTSFVDIANASPSFTTTAASSDVDVTVALEHQANHDRTFLRALIDGVPTGPSDVELSTNVGPIHAQTYSFVAKNIRPGTHTVRVQAAVDAGSTAWIGDRTVTVVAKKRVGTDFGQPYVELAPRVGAVPTVAICFDPQRPEHPKPSAAYLRGVHEGTDGGTNVQAWYRENTGSQFGFAPPTYIGCNDAGWLSPPPGRTGNWYWDTGNFPLMWHDALTAADPFFNFKAFDRNGDNAITGDELVVEIIRPQNQGDGFNRTGSATLDGVNMNVRVLDLYLSSLTDTPHRLTNVGLLAHEGAHDILGAADMYWGSAQRPLWYSVMDQHFNANHFDPFHKLKSGFVTPGLVEVNGLTTTTVPLASVETHREVTIVYDPARGDKEYFILENRWGGVYDANLPAQGVAVWHIVQDQATFDAFPPPFTGDPASAGEWGRKGVRLLGVLSAAGQSRTLSYADGTAAGLRITVKEGPQEFLDTEITRV